MSAIEEYLLNEYKAKNIEPQKFKFGSHDMILPVSYANKYGSTYSFRADLLYHYLKNKGGELKKYEHSDKEPRFLDFDGLSIVLPENLSHLSNEQAKDAVADAAYKRYCKTVALTCKVNNALPQEKTLVSLEHANIKKLNQKYNEFLYNHYKDKALVAAHKLRNIVAKSGKFFYNSLGNISKNILGKMQNRYSQKVNKVNLFAHSHNKELNKYLGTITVAGLLSMGLYTCSQHQETQETKEKSAQNYKPKQQNDIQEISDKEASIALLNDIINEGKTYFNRLSSNKYLLSPKLVHFLKNNGFEKLDNVQKYNIGVYLETRSASNVFIAFAEDFRAETYDDKKGFCTIGYGSTKYLDDNGKPLRKKSYLLGRSSSTVQMGQHITKEDAMEQVNRYSDFVILPQILKNVKVKMTKEQMVVTNNFAYVTGNQFDSSSYLKALNEKKPNDYLSQCLAMWNKDAGLPKRLFFSHLLLNGYIQPSDIIKFKSGGCYNLLLDKCLVCNKNPDGSTKMVKKKVIVKKNGSGGIKRVIKTSVSPDYKLKNGLPYFTNDTTVINQCIAEVKATNPDESVEAIMPKYCYNETALVFNKEKTNKSISLLHSSFIFNKNRE